MKKNFFVKICTVVASLLLVLCIVGCGSTTTPPKEENNYSPIGRRLRIGIGEVLNSARGSGEPLATDDYIAKMSKAMCCSAQRVWVKASEISSVTPDNTLEFDSEKIALYSAFFDKLLENGVKDICMMSDQFCSPYGFSGQLNSVPDYKTKPEEYALWVKLVGDFYSYVAKAFPQVKYFEVGNEVDYANYNGDKKPDENGRVWANDGIWHDGKLNYYSMEDVGKISADTLFVATQAVKAVDEKNIVMNSPTMGGTDLQAQGAMVYFYELYDAIKEGKTLSKDKNPDHYFQKMSIHPYPYYLSQATVQDWVKYQVENIYSIAGEYNHDVTCWFTEFGVPNDYNDQTHYWNNNNVKDWLPQYLDAIEKLDYVEVVIFFRLTDLYISKWNERENIMGLFLSPNYKSLPGAPKQTALTIYRWYTGKGADSTDTNGLYWYYLENKKD